MIGFSFSISINYMTAPHNAELEGLDITTIALMITAIVWPFMFFRFAHMIGSTIILVTGIVTAAIALDLVNTRHVLFSETAGQLPTQSFAFVFIIGISIILAPTINGFLFRRT